MSFLSLSSFENPILEQPNPNHTDDLNIVLYSLQASFSVSAT